MSRNSAYQFQSFGSNKSQPLQNPPGYSSIIRKRRKRRSKYDISYIYEEHSSGTTRSYFDYRPGQTKFYNPPDLGNLASDPSLNLRPQKDRTVFTDKQLLILEAAYQKNKRPDPNRREMVAELCELPLERVRIWYQNRRAKEKRVETDELAALAKRFCSNDGDRRRTSLCDSLSSINRHINRIFDHDDTIGEEDVIKKIIYQELYGQEMHARKSNDRWSHYRGSNVPRHSANTHTSEKELIRHFLRNDATPTESVCSKDTSNDESSISRGRKRKRSSKDFVDIDEHCTNVRYSDHEDATELRQQLINKQFASLDTTVLESREKYAVSSFTDVLNKQSLTMTSRKPTVPLDEALDQQQLYLLHLLNQRQQLMNYQNTFKHGGEQSPQNIPLTELGINQNLSPQCDLYNSSYGCNQLNSSVHTWIDFLNEGQSKLPPLVDVFQHQFNTTRNVGKYEEFQTGPKEQHKAINETVRLNSMSGGQRLKKFTQQDARDYEITRKIYEEELRLRRR